MPHITINGLSLVHTHKICFEDFSAIVHSGNRIGLIGANGSGKSSLLKIISGEMEATSGTIKTGSHEDIASIPQFSLRDVTLSGGEHFRKSLENALAQKPSILLLDEPSNHLDHENRTWLEKRLNSFYGTLIIATHDTHLLDRCIDTIWHIKDGKITVFSGSYHDYEEQCLRSLHSRARELEDMQKEYKKLNTSLTKLESRDKKSSKRKPKDKNLMSFGNTVSRGQAKTGHSVATLKSRSGELHDSIRANRIIEDPAPCFILKPGRQFSGTVVSISSGSCGYDTPVLSRISLSISYGEKVALTGRNTSGKSTLIKAIMGLRQVTRSGEWLVPHPKEIGYLDQHYATINPDKTPVETIHDANPGLSPTDIRKHLNSYHLRKNEDVFRKASSLSGGELARLSLARIAANPPRLLLLDEITNNIDLDTKKYMASILSQYPGALIVISHEDSFLEQLNLDARYQIDNGTLHYIS